MPSINVEIARNGETKIEANGFQGKGCAAVVDRIAAALGADPENLDHVWKPEAVESTGETVSGG